MNTLILKGKVNSIADVQSLKGVPREVSLIIIATPQVILKDGTLGWDGYQRTYKVVFSGMFDGKSLAAQALKFKQGQVIQVVGLLDYNEWYAEDGIRHDTEVQVTEIVE